VIWELIFFWGGGEEIAFDRYNFGSLYLLHQMFVFNQICWVLVPLKSCYCGKIFMSIQVVLNVWEEFKVQHPHIFALHWTSVAYNFFIHGPFSIIFVGKVAHTILVCVVKISCQYKKLWVNQNHFSRRFNHRCVFCNLFYYFFDIAKPFCKHNESIEWNFSSPICLYVGFKAHFSSMFFHLSRLRK